MYNFDFVIPSVLILIIFLVYFILKPKVPIFRYRVFFGILMTQLLVVLFDILSSQVDADPGRVSVPVGFFLNLGFFVLYLLRILAFFMATLAILRLHMTLSRLQKCGLYLVFLVSELITLSSIFTGTVFSFDADGYHRGPLYLILYVCFYFYLLVSLVLVLGFRKRLSREERIGAIGYNLVLIIGNVVRILLPHYLVMNTFCLLAIVILFLTYVNTDLYLAENGAFNQRAFQEVLDERIGRVNFDLLGFSMHNNIDLQEIYGLRQLSLGTSLIFQYLKEQYPKDLIFYLGVGRFVILGPAQMDKERMIRELKERFRKPWKAEQTELYLDVSFVIITEEAGLHSREAVLDSLTTVMNEISDRRIGGLDTVDLRHAHILERTVRVKRVLNKAIDENRVEVFLQPLVDAKTGKLVGAEALARLRDEEGIIIPPGEFIPIAERNGQINPLSDQVMERVCSFIRKYSMERMGLTYININLSPVQCQNQALYQHIAEIFKKNRVPARYIHLEITEESMVDFALLQAQMKKLQENGFRFALDDYGSGYSNISRVNHFPFVNIKIDMEIVRAHCDHPDRLLPAMVELFKDRGFSVTAEGIETQEMAETMRDIGCDYLQGFLYSKPLPMEDFVRKYAPELLKEAES